METTNIRHLFQCQTLAHFKICLKYIVSLFQISAIKTAVLFCQFFEISWKWSCQWLFECENSWKNAVISFDILCPARKFWEFALANHNWKTFCNFCKSLKEVSSLELLKNLSNQAEDRFSASKCSEIVDCSEAFGSPKILTRWNI